MKQLTFDEIDQVSGGCAEYCWGDFSMAGLGASIAAGVYQHNPLSRKINKGAFAPSPRETLSCLPTLLLF